ncbi:MAG TPA: bifunctional DNA primase/polymerase, partial [Polyangiaceae bacterium]|nr:bifunctional DNA primase/polymerase [Polyangiaceae bacterium]
GGGRRTNAADAAVEYRARGWRPVPIGPGAKAPHDPRSGRPLRGWATYELDARGLEAWRARGFGVGVVLGEASGGLADVDLDAPEAVALADAFLPPTGAAFGRASKPRSHRIFVAEGARTRRFVDGERASLVELRGAGAQTVFPPSRHPSGERIVWQGSSTSVLVVGASELARCVAALAVGALVLRRAPRVGAERRKRLAFAVVDGLAGAWARARELLPGPDLRAIERFAAVRVPERGPAADGPGAAPASRRRPAGPAEAARRVARAEAYLATCDAAVSGRGGHGTAFVAALKVIRGFSRDEADARSWEPEWRRLLAEYNRRCVPPWSRRELEYKIGDALRRAAVRWGFLLDALPRGRAARYDGPRR